MTPPAPECTCGETEKAELWPKDDSERAYARFPRVVAGPADLQSARSRISF